MYSKRIIHFILSIIGLVVFLVYLHSFLLIFNSNIIGEYVDSNTISSYIERDGFYTHLFFCVYGAISASLCVFAGCLSVMPKNKQLYWIVSIISFISCMPAVLLIGFNILVILFFKYFA